MIIIVVEELGEFIQKKISQTSAKFNDIYMGDDEINGQLNSVSMYVNMIERKVAINSTSKEKFDLLPTIEEMYSFLRGSYGNK